MPNGKYIVPPALILNSWILATLYRVFQKELYNFESV